MEIQHLKLVIATKLPPWILVEGFGTLKKIGAHNLLQKVPTTYLPNLLTFSKLENSTIENWDSYI